MAGVLAALVATDGQSFFSSNIYQAGPLLGLGFLLGLAEAAMRDRLQYAPSPESDSTPEPLYKLSPSRSMTALGSGLVLSLVATFLLMGPVFRSSIADILVRSAIHDKNAGQWDAAADRFEEACHTDSYSFDAPYYRTLLALEQGRPRTALEFANRANNLQPHHYMTLFYRGLALEKAGKTAEAAEDFKQVLRLFPPYQPAREGLERLGISLES
jgi:tetratricopeptide (TPR) repeat protein